jgi:hypothetical protein
VLPWLVTDHLSIREIAGILERSEGATREYLSQCRKKLEPFLQVCRELLQHARTTLFTDRLALASASISRHRGAFSLRPDAHVAGSTDPDCRKRSHAALIGVSTYPSLSQKYQLSGPANDS